MSRVTQRPTPVLYLAGLGRSGSTLLERTFAGLEGAVAVGELVHLWQRGLLSNERCGCGAAFLDCEFWGAVGDRAYGGWGQVDAAEMVELSERVDRTRYVPYMVTSTGPKSYRRDVGRLVSVLGPLYPAIADVSGAAVVVDSSKDPSYAYLLSRAAEIDLRVAHTIRDSPAVAYSWAKRVVRPDAHASTMSRWSPRRTSVMWSGLNLVVRGLARRGVPVELARYEDFVVDPAATFLRLVERLDLPRPAPDGPLLAGLREGHIDLGVDHTVSGNPIRFETGRMSIAEDRAWVEAFPAADRRLVEVLTAPVRLRFGYLGR
jgi:hypothetical protein